MLRLSTDDLGGLLTPLRSLDGDLADQLQSVQMELSERESGEVFPVPHVEKARRDAVLSQAQAQLQRATGEGNREVARTFLEGLRKLFYVCGRELPVFAGNGASRCILTTQNDLPADLAPILVLDASADIRQTYAVWGSTREDGPVRLPSARKDHSALQLHLMDKGGGKDSWRRGGDWLAWEIAMLINSKPNEDWLVVHHKAFGGVDPEQMIRRHLPASKRSRVRFLHWGTHQATNEHRDVPNVVLAGLIHLPEYALHGLAWASSGCSVGENLQADALEEMRKGELGHAVVQAVGRVKVRQCLNGSCPPCNAYIIAAKRDGLQKALKRWFPGAQVTTWRPRSQTPKGQVATAVAYLKMCLDRAPHDPILFVDVMARLGNMDASNFRRCIRRHPDMQAELEKLGLREVTTGDARGPNAFQCSSSFGPIDEEL